MQAAVFSDKLMDLEFQHRDKDRMHLRDLIAVELVDESWPPQFPVGLAARLQTILDDPEG
jgi:hypothetical protein